MTQRHQVCKYCWTNGADSLAQCRTATHLQFVKQVVSAKDNKAKNNKTRYPCISTRWGITQLQILPILETYLYFHIMDYPPCPLSFYWLIFLSPLIHKFSHLLNMSPSKQNTPKAAAAVNNNSQIWLWLFLLNKTI